ncbi:MULTISPECIES: hypothetical protein [unclassified Nocardiopsis]|uniref:hypothetical protein n=1 Tax=Nocardiopsis TaxID=2013 RepID=UPI00387B5432
MGGTGQILVAVGAGYVLGRRRKFKVAVALAMYIAMKKLKIDPRKLAREVRDEIASSPLLEQLKKETREQVAGAGKGAVDTLVTGWAERLADSLNARTESLGGGSGESEQAEKGEESAKEEEPEKEEAGKDEEPEAENGEGTGSEEEEEEPGEAAEEKPPEKPKRRRASTAKGTSGGTSRKPAARKRSTRSGSSGGRTRKPAAEEGGQDG